MNAEKFQPVLIVEDDPALQKQIKWSLDRFESVMAEDRESAMVQLRRCAPAVVTMDLGLPPDADSVSEGFRLLEQIMAFDPNRDVAVLHVPNLGLAGLPMSGAAEGGRGAVFGYPGGGDLKVSPYRISELVTAVGADIYDRRPTRRPILILASNLARGDSGGALINTESQVAGLAFAISPDRPGVAYALQIKEVRAVLAQVTGSPVGTGRCIA